MENQTLNTQNTERKETKWIFLPLLKAHIYKRTDTYILFDVDGIASGIISAKFLRKKETEDMVYFSLPEDYEINVNVREKVDGKWQPKAQWKIKAKDLQQKIFDYNKVK